MNEIQFFCVHCGQHISIDANAEGVQTNCPTCHGEITVPIVGAKTSPPPLLRPLLAPSALQSPETVNLTAKGIQQPPPQITQKNNLWLSQGNFALTIYLLGIVLGLCGLPSFQNMQNSGGSDAMLGVYGIGSICIIAGLVLATSAIIRKDGKIGGMIVATLFLGSLFVLMVGIIIAGATQGR